MAFLDLFKTKNKKPAAPITTSFDVLEATQSYRLQEYGYLYEAPKDSYLYLYKALYDNVPVLDGAINAYTDLVCSGWSINSDKPKEAELITSELQNTNFDKVLKTMMDDYFIYGFYGIEMVPSKRLNKIMKFQQIPAEQLRLERNDLGDIIQFFQTASPRVIKFNPAMVLFSANRESTTEPYGRSLFKSMPWISRVMLEMQDSMNKIYRRYGSPRFHVKYTPAVQLDQTTLETRLRAIKTKFKDIEVGQDFFTAGDVEIAMIGAGSGQQFRLTIEMAEIMQAVFSGLKLPAGVLGYNYGSTETHLKKQVEILLGRILSYQKEQAGIINLKLMPLLATLYNLKSIPKLEFDKPIITDEAADAALEGAKISNALNLVNAGLITVADAQQKLGLEVKEIEKPEIEDDEENKDEDSKDKEKKKLKKEENSNA